MSFADLPSEDELLDQTLTAWIVHARAAEAEVESLRQQLQGAVDALRRIERLARKWDAQPAGDRDPWAAVGSEAHKIAADYLGGR